MRQLIALEPEVYRRLKNHETVEQKIVSDLDKEMQQILDSSLSQEQKIKLYNQALQKVLHFEKKSPNPEVVLKTKQEPVTETTILKSFPDHTKRKRAKKVLEDIKENKSAEWDDQSRFVLDKQPVPGSNIIELINEASTKVTKKRKRRKLPGWGEFEAIWKST